MTTEYYGMTPWEYNEWARSRETAGDYTYVWDGRGSIPTSWGRNVNDGPASNPGSGGSGGGGTQTPSTPSTPSTPVDPYKNIDRSPFEINDHDAIALAQQQRVRDATSYRHNLAGLPQPIELWSGSVADTQRTTPLGTVASLMPGQGAFAPTDSYRDYVLAREAYMNDGITQAQQGGSTPTTPSTPGGSGGTGSTPTTPTTPTTPSNPVAPPADYLNSDYWRRLASRLG